MYVPHIALIIGLLGTVSAWAQDSLLMPRPEVVLEGVDIVALKGHLHQIPSHGSQGHVGQQLDLHSGHLVKYNGPVGLASINMWGLGGQHTAIAWQGINLQSTMNGYADLNLMPGFLFDQVSLGNGDLGLPLGGGIGGSLSLIGKSGRNQAMLGIASFANRQFGLAISPFQKRKNKLQITAFHSYGLNEFTYRMYETSKRLSHAYLQQSHLTAQWEWSPSTHKTWWASTWLMKAYRQLPPTFYEKQSEAEQRDRNLRLAIGYRTTSPKVPGHKKSLQWTINQEYIAYRDPLKNILGQNTSTTALMLFAHEWAQQQPPGSGTLLKLGWGTTVGLGHARALDYTSMGSFPIAALHILLQSTNPTKTRKWTAGAKAEHFAERTAWACDLSARYVPNNSIVIQLFAGKTYRFPTFNDLLWKDGGNPRLKTEKGYKAHMELEYRWQTGWSLRAQAHTALVQDWIQWVPNSHGVWMAQNVKHVWARGLETTCEKTWKLNRYEIQARMVYALTRTEPIAHGQRIGFGPQMPYTPYHKAVGFMGIKYKSVECTLDHQALGKRFTNSDNTEALRPYLLSNLGISYSWKWLRVKADALNLFNVQYQSTIMYGMPGRNYRAQLVVDLAGACGGKKQGK